MSFICPLCLTNRDFSSFSKMFRHITLYHQNTPNFQITCDLHSTCGVLYRTYSGYKAHIYRKHLIELHSTEQHNHSNTISIDNQCNENVNVDVESKSIDPDGNYASDFIDYNTEFVPLNDYSDAVSSTFVSSDGNEENIRSIKDIKKNFLLFILQLREDFLIPKNVTNVITTYITTLIHHIEFLLQKKTFNYSIDSYLIPSSSSGNQAKKAIEFDELKYLFNDIRIAIELITKNEYQLIKHCEEYFNYTPVQEIPLSSANEDSDFGYYIPIDKSLSSILNSRSFSTKILENIHQQQLAKELDDDLMFSIRNSYYGSRLDDNHLLIQLYLDDISLTNPLGSKRDQQKYSMIYFTLEDVPDEHRSKLDFIQLLGICNSRILKVKALINLG